MATTYYNDIQKLYVAYFNRPGDPSGLAFWETAVEGAKGSTAVVAAEFAKQAEYTANYSGKTNAQIVDQVYQNLFGRSSSGDTGADFWVKGLENKTITIADVVTAVAAGAQGTDKTAFNNKVAAAVQFTAALDTKAEQDGYKGDAANKIAKDFLASVTTDASFAAATTPATLNKTVALAVAAGTPFTVAGALASLDAAQTAIDKFVASVDVDGDTDTDTTVADIGTAYSTAKHNVALKLDTSVQSLFEATTTTEAVRDALVSAQQATLSADLAAKQTLLANTNTAISKVAGLSGAVSTLAAAKTAESTANKALVAANADVAAKQASFQVNNAGTLKSVADADGNVTLVLDYTDTTKTDATVATVAASGKVTVVSGLDTTKYAGLTDVVASINAQVAANAAVNTAHKTTLAAQAEVNHLDVDATTKVGGGTETEASLLASVTKSINDYATAHKDTVKAVAVGSTATEGEITTALAVMQANDAKFGTTEYESFDALVSTYRTAAASNPLASTLTSQTDLVKNATTAISDLTKLVTKMDAAQANVDTLAGLTATLKASSDVLEAKGYHVNDTTIGTAAADIFTVDSLKAGDSTTIALFNLQGTDSVFVGSGYKLVQGEVGDVKGDNAALEVFVSANDSGDAVLQIETSAFGSSASTPEIITVTLTGVDATALHLSNGIISTATIA
jgi:hypothetical protein